MKPKLLLPLALAAALAVGAAQAKTIKMEVHGLVCAFCAQGIDKKLRTMAPTKDVFVSLEHKLVAIATRDGADISDAELTEALTDAGYDVKGITRTQRSLGEIRSELGQAAK